jgi:hypothetical protein
MLRRRMIINNLVELLEMDLDMTVAQLLSSILRNKQYSVEDVYYAEDIEVSSVIERHLQEYKENSVKATEKEIEEFIQNNTKK